MNGANYDLETREGLKEFYTFCLEQTMKDIDRIEKTGSERQKRQHLWTLKRSAEDYKKILKDLNKKE